MIKNILIFLFAIRPVIDLAWEEEFLLGMNLAGIVATFIIALTIIYGFKQREITKIRSLSVGTGLLFFAYIAIITLINTTQLSDYNYAIRLLSELAFLIIVAPHISLKNLNKLMIWFLVVTLVPILLTYGQVAGIVEYTYFDYVDGNQISRGSGGYRQPSVLTRFCSIGLLYALYLLEIRKGEVKYRFFLYTYMVLNLIAVIFSYHRTGMFLVFFLTILWYLLKEKRRLSSGVIKVVFATGGIFAVAILVYHMNLISVELSVIQSMLSLDNIIAISSSGSYQFSLRGRGDILLVLVNGLVNNPLIYSIFGNGVAQNAVTHITIDPADMEFIRVLWNGGIIGCLLWLWHFVTIKRNIDRWKNEKRISSFYRLAICMFWCFIVWGLCIEATESPNLMYHVYLICGWCSFKRNVIKNI